MTIVDLFHFNINNSKFKDYGRLNGWILTNRLRFPTQSICYVVDSISDASWYECYKHSNVLYCRADAPWGKGNKLLRSADIFNEEELLQFLKDAKSTVQDAIVLVFQHPSIWLTQKYMPRYLTSGAAIVLFDWEISVTIEYVGPGFDCGDISRGKTVHSRIVIPWDMLFEDVKNVIRYSKLFNQSYYMSDLEYHQSRYERIQQLLCSYGNEFELAIEQSIPHQVTYINEQILSQIYINYIDRLIYSDIISRSSSYAIMFNLYCNMPYTYEVWQPKRSII